VQFLKEKGIATDDDLKPYFEQATGASSVRWRAVRVRMERLLTAAAKSDDDKTRKQEKTEQAQAAKSAKDKDAENHTPDEKAAATRGTPENNDEIAEGKKEGSPGASKIESKNREPMNDEDKAAPQPGKNHQEAPVHSEQKPSKPEDSGKKAEAERHPPEADETGRKSA
jgi:hypothetical protein